MSNFAIPGGSGVFAATIQTVVPSKESDAAKNAPGTKDEKPDIKDSLNMFSPFAGIALKTSNNSEHSKLDSLREALEGLFGKQDGNHSDKPLQPGDGQASIGPGIADMPDVIPNGSKTVVHSPQSGISHDQAAGLQALLEGVFAKLGGGKHSDKPVDPEASQAHLGSANIS